ncbi:hypothetical protein NL676_023373 [Syzygium grande]|nr:hypothetical protein NL676_023373 [Syzygium grande]
MICAGVSVSFIIGTVLGWRVLALIGLIPCAVLLFGLFFIPESPRWLAKTGHEKDFKAALQKLRGKDADISGEAAEIQVIVTAIGVALVDRAGRKPLLLISGTGLILGCIITALSFFLKVYDLTADAVPILAVTGILLYIAAFSVGMGAVPWVVMSEIFPINIKGVAGGTFLLYAAINAAGMVFVITVVPETKGRSLEQIQAAINTE